MSKIHNLRWSQHGDCLPACLADRDRGLGLGQVGCSCDRDIDDALEARFGHEMDGADPVARSRHETLNGIHSNAAGLKRWLETRGPSAEAGHAHL
jgi:hypothetical protein